MVRGGARWQSYTRIEIDLDWPNADPSTVISCDMEGYCKGTEREFSFVSVAKLEE